MVRMLGSRRRVASRGRWARVGLAVVRVPQGELALLGFLSSYMVCRRRTRPPPSVTWDRMEVTTCLPWESDNSPVGAAETPCLRTFQAR